MVGPERSIGVRVATIVPDEDEEDGFAREWGEDEAIPIVPDAVDRRDGLTVVDIAARALVRVGARPREPFRRGVRYETEPEPQGDGRETSKSLRLRGFTTEEEAAVYAKVRDASRR